MAGSNSAGASYTVDFTDVSTVGLESSPHAEALAEIEPTTPEIPA